MMFRSTLAVLVILVAAPILAAEEEAPDSPWAGSATLGYLATSGNTNNSNLNSGLEVGYTIGSWRHEFNGRAIYAAEDNTTTSEAYAAGLKSERNLSKRSFLFGRLNWRKDRFSGYDTQFSQTVGYGRRVIDNDVHKLNIEVGAGARQSDLVDGRSENETILLGDLNYTWALSDNSEFRQNFLFEAGSSNTYLASVTALSAKLVGNLAFVASYTVKNNSDVPIGTKKTDTYSALSLEYGF
jgi:putative salt-induced outer membrane protein